VATMQRRLERLEASVYEDYYEDIYWDEDVGSLCNVDLLSRAECKSMVKRAAEDVLDSKNFNEKEIILYEFSDRPQCFPEPDLPEVSVG
jgi:hypothetical protein